MKIKTTQVFDINQSLGRYFLEETKYSKYFSKNLTIGNDNIIHGRVFGM